MLSKYRDYFPHVKNKVYLNHASISPLSKRVTSAIHEYLVRRSESEVEVYPGFINFIDDTRKSIGKLINANPTDIAFQTNTSDGLNVLANGIKWKRGDRIILYSKDFPSVTQTFYKLQKEGVIIDFLKPRDNQIDLDDILRLIKPETALVCLSHVQFMNGYRLNLDQVGKLCSDKGVIFAVDAIQSAGALTIDVKKSQIDFLATAGHKWLMSPTGTGFIYVSEELRSMIQPVYIGWTSVAEPWDFFNLNQPLHPHSKRFEPGTLNGIGIVGMRAAIDLFLEIGMHKIEHTIMELSSYLITSLKKAGYRLAFDYDMDNLSGIVSFYMTEPDKICTYLAQKNIIVTHREGLIRVSPHFYNNKEEIDLFVKNLKEAETRYKFENSKALLESYKKQLPVK